MSHPKPLRIRMEGAPTPRPGEYKDQWEASKLARRLGLGFRCGVVVEYVPPDGGPQPTEVVLAWAWIPHDGPNQGRMRRTKW